MEGEKSMHLLRGGIKTRRIFIKIRGMYYGGDEFSSQEIHDRGRFLLNLGWHYEEALDQSD